MSAETTTLIARKRKDLLRINKSKELLADIKDLNNNSLRIRAAILSRLEDLEIELIADISHLALIEE